MNDFYTKEELKRKLSISKIISWSLFLLILSPAPFTALTAYRCFSMQTINIIGVCFAVVTVIAGGILLVKGILGIVRFYTLIKSELQVSEETMVWLEKRKENSLKNLFITFLSSLILFFMGTVSSMTTSSLYRSNNSYVIAGYIGVFIFFGVGLCVILNAALKYFMLRGIKCLAAEEVSNYEVKDKKKYKFKFVLVSLSIVIILIALMFRGTWYIQPYIATIPSVKHRQIPVDYDKDSGVYTIKNPKKGDFKILQLTDVHIGGSLLSYQKDLRALQTVYELIERTRPDFIIVTGDFVFPLGIESFSFNNYTPMMQFCSFMRNIGIPWAMTYGNHDTEFVASHSEEELNSLFGKFDYERTGTLMYADVQPDISGRANQMILLKNSDDSVNQVLYLIDSNSYTGKGINDYDNIHEDQVKWYADTLNSLCEKEGRIVPSLIFTHIPLKEYKTAYDLYKNNNSSVKYYYGEIGEKNETICCSDYSSDLFKRAVEIGSTKGVFCGHDHYNNISMEYKGIRLTYGMSIDYLAMPGIKNDTKQRGATTIIVYEDGSFDVEPVPYNK